MHTPTAYHPPEWATSIQRTPAGRISLAQRPTPLKPWSPPGLEHAECWIKRDDMTGSTLSGNKVRKLEFLLADAVESGCDIVLTCGGIQSNHARATAVAARELGLDSILFLRTEKRGKDPGFAGNLLLDRMVGAELVLITPEDYRRRMELMEQHAEQLRNDGRTPYVIPEGGSNAIGTWGYIEAVREIAQQSEEGGLAFDHIVFACGSGGTAAGLSLGVHLAGLSAQVHAVNVCDDAATFHQKVNDIYKDLGVEFTSEELLHMVDGHVGRGYAKSTREELAYLRDTARSTGIILDPVYSGKALFGLAEELARHDSPFTGNRILFMHTGGLFGLYDKMDGLEDLLI